MSNEPVHLAKVGASDYYLRPGLFLPQVGEMSKAILTVLARNPSHKINQALFLRRCAAASCSQILPFLKQF